MTDLYRLYTQARDAAADIAGAIAARVIENQPIHDALKVSYRLAMVEVDRTWSAWFAVRNDVTNSRQSVA